MCPECLHRSTQLRPTRTVVPLRSIEISPPSHKPLSKRRMIEDAPSPFPGGFPSCLPRESSTTDMESEVSIFSPGTAQCFYSQETRDTNDSFQEWDILEDGGWSNEQDLLEQQSYLELVDQLPDEPTFSLDSTFDEQVVLNKARRNLLYRQHVWQLLGRYKTPAPAEPSPKTPCELPHTDCSNLAREIYSALHCEEYTAAAGRAASDFITLSIVKKIDAQSATNTKYDILNMLGKIFGNVSSWVPNTDSILAIQTGPFLYELAVSLLQVGQLLSASEAAQFCHHDEFLADVVLPAHRNVERIGQMPYNIIKDFVNLLQRSLAQPAEVGGVAHDVVNRSISRNMEYDDCISSHEHEATNGSRVASKFPKNAASHGIWDLPHSPEPEDSSRTRGGIPSVVMAGFDPTPHSLAVAAPYSRSASPAVLPTHLADTHSTAPAILPEIHPTPKHEVVIDPDLECLLVAKRLANATDRLQTDKDEIERLIHSTISNISAKSSPKRLIKRLEILVAIGHHVIARRNEKVPEPNNPWTDEVMQKLLTDSMLNICHMVGGNPKPRDFEFKYPHLLKNITADMMDLNRKGQLGKIKCLPGMGRVLSWFGLLGRCLADPRCVD